MISTENKFIFIHNPKCGSTYVSQILAPYSDIWDVPWREQDLKNMKIPHHAPPKKIEKAFSYQEKENFDDYFKLTTIRNPWDRMVSWWSWGRWSKDFVPFYKDKEGDHDIPKTEMSFDDWINNAESEHIKELTNSFNADSFLHDGSELMVDLIIRLEDFNSSLFPALSMLIKDFVKPDSFTRNRSKRGPYQEYYNNKTKKIVEKKFEKDIEIGRYQF